MFLRWNTFLTTTNAQLDITFNDQHNTHATYHCCTEMNIHISCLAMLPIHPDRKRSQPRLRLFRYWEIQKYFRSNKCIENNRKWLHITCEFIKIGTFNPIKTHIATSFFNILLGALKMKTNWIWWKFFFFGGGMQIKRHVLSFFVEKVCHGKRPYCDQLSFYSTVPIYIICQTVLYWSILLLT